MKEIDLPECFFEHDENGNRISLSQLGTYAVLFFAFEIAERIFQMLRQMVRAPRSPQ